MEFPCSLKKLTLSSSFNQSIVAAKWPPALEVRRGARRIERSAIAVAQTHAERPCLCIPCPGIQEACVSNKFEGPNGVFWRRGIGRLDYNILRIKDHLDEQNRVQ